MEKHVTVVAALQIGLSIAGILIAGIVFIILAWSGFIAQDQEAFLILITVGGGIAGFLLLLSVPGIIGGIGLFKRRNWARILILIVSAIDLLNFPIGTALGIYSIWVLVQNETVQLFIERKTE